MPPHTPLTLSVLTAPLLEAATVTTRSASTPLVLRGGADAFCRGLPLDLPDTQPALSPFAALLRALDAASVPVIAVADGDALGGGLGLLCAADLVIAHPRARFGLPETLIGLLPATIFPWVARRIGPTLTRRLALGDPPLSAAEALSAGLVDVVSSDPDDVLADRLERLSRMDPRAVAALRALFARHYGPSELWLADAIPAFDQLWASAATRARIARLQDGDPPWATP